jgi:hypothetical protein
LDQTPVIRFQDRCHRSALLEDARKLLFPRIPVLAQDSIPQPDVAAPVLSINDQDAAGTDENVIDVGLRPSRPMNVMKGKPASGLQPGHSVRDHGLAGSAYRPSMGIPLSLLQLFSQPLHAFRG